MPMLKRQSIDLWSYHAVSGAGAFVIGFSDLLRGGNDSTSVTVLRISEVLRVYFSPHLSEGWFALVFLFLLGVLLSYIYQPTTRKDAFILGMGVFALLTAASPYKVGKQAAIDIDTIHFSFISSAIAQDIVSEKKFDYYFEFVGGGSSRRPKDLLITVYNKKGDEIIDRRNINSNEILKLSYPRGSYVAYVECKGCKRVSIDLDFDKELQASKLELPESGVPLSLQRLIRPSVVSSTDMNSKDALELSKKYKKMER